MDSATSTLKRKKTRIFPAKPHYFRTESAPSGASFSRKVGVDRENGIIRGYVVAQEGVVKSGDHAFDHKTLEQIANLTNASKHGIKSRFTHPGLSDDGLGKFLGRSKNATIQDVQGKASVVADLHLDKTALDTPPAGGKPYGVYIMDLAESDPAALSSSIVTYEYSMVALDANGEEKVVGRFDDLKNDQVPILRLSGLHASDIVDTGNAVDDLLAAGANVPDSMLVWKGAELLDRVFEGQPRDVIEMRASAFLNRYLDWRHPKHESNQKNFLIGDETMAKDEVQKADTSLQDQLNEQKEKLEKLSGALEIANAQLEHYKTENQDLRGEVSNLRDKELVRDVEKDFEADAMRGKLRSDERESRKELAITLKKNQQTEISAGTPKEKTSYEQYMDSLRARKEVAPRLEKLSGGVGHENKGEVPASKREAIAQFAEDNSIKLIDDKAFNKAEEGAAKMWPELWKKVAGGEN